MLERVQAIWIDGVLEPSVQGAAQITLELQHKPSAVVTPLWHVLREFDTTGRLSSVNASIVQVYDHASGEVLILGEPGAGKTTLLLELTRLCWNEHVRMRRIPSPWSFPSPPGQQNDNRSRSGSHPNSTEVPGSPSTGNVVDRDGSGAAAAGWIG